METKTQQAVNLFKGGQIKRSLKLFSNFKLGISKDDRDTLKVAHEMLSGNEDFYKRIGYDLDHTVDEAKGIIKKIWIR